MLSFRLILSVNYSSMITKITIHHARVYSTSPYMTLNILEYPGRGYILALPWLWGHTRPNSTQQQALVAWRMTSI